MIPSHEDGWAGSHLQPRVILPKRIHGAEFLGAGERLQVGLIPDGLQKEAPEKLPLGHRFVCMDA